MFLTHLESPVDGSTFSPDQLRTTHEGRPLLARYDLARVAQAVTRQQLRDRPMTMWRYRELLPAPHAEAIVSLGEGGSPIVPCPRLGEALGAPGLLIKDESQLPTGSFKARGMSAAITMAKALGATSVALPTAGNAGAAASAYAARAGLPCVVFMPSDTPLVNRLEPALFGARAFLVDGLISDCGAIVREGAQRFGWFDLSTLKEPYRLEGKKTMGLELVEQLGWRTPGAIFYPTGGGTGLIGMWKAFAELRALGWLDERQPPPRMFACQSTGCAPIVRAFEAGEAHAAFWEGADTMATGLRVPAAVGDFLILDAVRQSGGAAIATPEEDLAELMALAGRLEGISLCPEAAVALGAVRTAIARGIVSAEEEILVFNTGAVQKYTEAMERAAQPVRIDKNDVDWSAIERALALR